ncbi:MAG: hypothetical protein J2P37_06480 [Ktedonobacteraceae bacterium]|nr:hypothetical protein [Ktedonobacteraceae bacterium]MBO0793525.1 hypothetical protein [Ktedonobacteraceae bacterium]
MKRQDLSVEQIRAAFKKQQDDFNAAVKKQQELETALLETLVTRAQLQEYTERQFNDLVQVAREGIKLVMEVVPGDVVRPEWTAQRDVLVERAQRLIQDAD